uniref:RRM domain-containing protein n=1 Tax=Echinostoma caproni TaxID=27848 RepID=A0A183A2M9_9TREM
LATYRNGVPKGHAYVEFSNADEASRALIATDGLMVGSKNISVAISNPPVRNDPHSKLGYSGTADTKVAETKTGNSVKPPQFAVPSAPVGKP